MKKIPMAELSIYTLINECRKDNISKDDCYKYFNAKNKENVHKVFGYRKYNYNFTDYVTCYHDGSKIIGYIRPSYDDFLRNLCLFLNIPITGEIVDNEELNTLLMSRLNFLKNIRNVWELKEFFPIIHQDYIDGRKLYAQIEAKKPKEDEDSSEYDKERKTYFRHALHPCFINSENSKQDFMGIQIEFYNRLITRRKEYKKLIESKCYNAFIGQFFDINKVALYTVHIYLTKCETSQDLETIKKYYKLVEKYLEEKEYKKNISIRVGEDIIDWYNINSRMKAVKRMVSQKELTVNWKILPLKKGEHLHMKQEGTPKETLLNYEEIEALRTFGERRNRFYENSNYYRVAIGLNKLKGYVAYFYLNGEVILDRIYDNTLKSAKGNRWFNINYIDFEELSKLGKSELKERIPVGEHSGYHSKYWMNKVSKITNKETTKETEEGVKSLIKKLERSE